MGTRGEIVTAPPEWRRPTGATPSADTMVSRDAKMDLAMREEQKCRSYSWEGDQAEGVGQVKAGRLRVLTVNISKQLAVSSQLRPKGELRRAWMDELNFWRAARADVICIQEAGLGADAGDVMRARRWLRVWSKENKIDVGFWSNAGPGGAASGLITLAFGQWAHCGRAHRAWSDGRGLWVEFAIAGAALVIGNVYGPASGTPQEKTDWRADVAWERTECIDRGARVAVFGDTNQKETSEDVSHEQRVDPLLHAWLTEEEVRDAWRVRHGALPGLTRRYLHEGQPRGSRLDVGWLDRGGGKRLDAFGLLSGQSSTKLETIGSCLSNWRCPNGWQWATHLCGRASRMRW